MDGHSRLVVEDIRRNRVHQATSRTWVALSLETVSSAKALAFPTAWGIPLTCEGSRLDSVPPYAKTARYGARSVILVWNTSTPALAKLASIRLRSRVRIAALVRVKRTAMGIRILNAS